MQVGRGASTASSSVPPSVARPSQSLAAGFAWLAEHEYVALLGVLVAMLLVRVVALGSVPDTLNPDEADNIQGALRILHGQPPNNGFFGLDWYGEPAMTAYVFAAALKIFGVSPFAARLSTALISTLALAVFYLVLRRQVSVLAALLSTLLFGSQLWYLQMSRMAWVNVHVTLFSLGAVFALLNALSTPHTRRGRLWFLGCGVCCALTLYSYPAGRALLASLYVTLPFAILRNRRRWLSILLGYVAMGLLTLVLFLPEAVFVAAHWDAFMLRFTTVSLLSKPEFQADPVQVLARQFEANLLGFWVGQFDNVAAHFPVGEPLLDPLTGLLVAVGAVLSVAIRRFRAQFETWLWWAILLLGWVLSEVLTQGTPDAARATSWIPSLFIFVGMSLDIALAWANRLGTTARSLASAGICVAVVLAAWADVAHYVDWIGLASTRDNRQPYVSTSEFSDWSAAVIQRADTQASGFSVDEWRTTHAISPTAIATTTPTIKLPDTPRAQWLDTLSTFGASGPGQLSQPRSIALDDLGNAYVVDGDPNVEAIKKYDPSGSFLLAWGRPGDQEGQFRSAWAVAVDAQDRVLVLDAETGWVQVFDASGNFLSQWGGPSAKLYHPRTLAVAADGSVLIADTGGGRVVQTSRDGQGEREYASAGPGVPSEPAGVASLPNGGLAIADARGALRIFGADGTQTAQWPFPPMVAQDAPRVAQVPDGSLYVTAPDACALEHVSLTGELLATIGSCGATDYLQYPSAVAADASGRLYVADLKQQLVKVFQTTSTSP